MIQFIIGICFVLLSPSGDNVSALGNADLETIRNRMNDLSFNIPNVKRPVPTHSTELTTLLPSLDQFNADGSYKTPLPNITEAEKNNAGSKFDQHRAFLKEVKNIAVLYGYNNYYPGSIPASHHGRAAYKNLVYNSLKWYFKNHKPPTSVYHETFNYHEYQVTTVGLLEYIGMLLFDDFHTDRLTDPSLQNLFDDIVVYCHHVITDNPQSRGPNWSFRYGNSMRHVLFSDDPAEMEAYMAVNNASLNFDVWAKNGTDGLWPDWSLTHHGDENYWGMYGTSWFSNTLELAGALKGTPWEYSEKNIQFIEQSVVEGLQWILYKGNTEFTTAPKRLTYWLDRTDVVAQGVIDQLKILVQLHGDKLQDRSQIDHLINNIDPSWQNSGGTYNEVTGHKYFWNTEYQVHRRSNYSIAVRRTSQRVRGPEDSSNSNIKCHLHFGSGYTSILRRGDEYRLSRLGFDYQSLPGTTTERNGIINAGKSASTKRGTNLFSGGVSEDDFGAGAFEMKLGQYNNGKWELINGAGALKGNFFFGKEMLALGQNVKRIKAGTDEIWTTINQLQRRDQIVYSVDKQAPIIIDLNETVNDQLSVAAEAWFWHDQVGYIISTKKTTNIKLLAERRVLHPVLMQDVYKNAISAEDRTLGKINMFQLAINHGRNPGNEAYSYRVVPDISLKDFQQYITQNATIIIKNSDQIQAAYNAVDSVLEAVFYEPGKFTFDNDKTIEVDRKIMIMIRQSRGELFVSVANPVHRGLTPSFVSSASKTIGELYETPVNISLKGFGIKDEVDRTVVVPIQLPSERAYEGKTITQKLQLQASGGFTAVDEVLEMDTKIFPDPFSTQLTVLADPIFKKLELYSLSGKKMLYLPFHLKQTLDFDVDFPSGLYILKLSRERFFRTYKVLKIQ